MLGIFGPNASGKSAIIDAIRYAFTAIEKSATAWQADSGMRRLPFLLDDHSKQEPSLYELEFVYEDVRYVYGFEVDARGIVREWLRDVPSTRWRTLLARERKDIRFHATVAPIHSIAERELVLSRAIIAGQGVLRELGQHLVEAFDATTVKDTHRERRLAAITESLTNGSLTFDDMVTLLQVADIGVAKVDIQEDALPVEIQEIFKGLSELLASRKKADANGGKEARPQIELNIQESDAVVRNLVFTHYGSGKQIPPFPIQSESDGTIAWLALIVPALEILRCGGLFCVDEIDSSLHPHLVELLLGIFADPELNAKRAQLIFTSHDSYLLSPLSDVKLEPEQVWFTQKNGEGVTELVCLSDFPRHRDANVAKRYLTGRYGGTPHLAPSVLGRLLSGDQ